MKHLPVAGVVVAVLALFLSSAALVARPGGGDDVTAKLDELNGSIAALGGRVGTLKADLASVSAKPGSASTTFARLRARVAKAETEAASLERALADLPRGSAAAGGEIDPGKLRELVQAGITTAREEQTRQWADRMRSAMTTRFREDVGLDENKAEKASAVVQKAFGEMGRIWRENRGDRDAVRKAMEELQKKGEQEMAEFLTEDELGRMLKFRDQQMQRWGNRGNRGGGNRGGDRQQPPAGQDGGQGGDDPAPF